MQSSADHVLAALDRRHTPGRAAAAVAEAHAAGFEHVNVDLIYGAAGETDADWKDSLHAAVDTGADHISAYSLIVEPGTRLAADVRSGRAAAPEDDVLAERYVMAEEILNGAGMQWYEVSNWARSASAICRHNVLYWTGANWWGVGPGAHSHIGGVRWWNVKHPTAYAARLAADTSPAAARETLSGDERYVEDIMLRLRLRDGLRLDSLRPAGREAARQARDGGTLDGAEYDDGRAVLTLQGRLLADAVIRDLV